MKGPPQNTVSGALNVSKPAAFGVEWFDYCVVSFIYSDFVGTTRRTNLQLGPCAFAASYARLNFTTFYQKIMNRTVV